MATVRGPELALRYAELRVAADEDIAAQLGYPSARRLAERLARQGEAQYARTIDGRVRYQRAIADLRAEQVQTPPDPPDPTLTDLRTVIEALAAAMQEPKHTSKEGKAP